MARPIVSELAQPYSTLVGPRLYSQLACKQLLPPDAVNAQPGFLYATVDTHAGANKYPGLLYATLGTVLRPVRFGWAVSLTPVYGAVVRWLQARLPLPP